MKTLIIVHSPTWFTELSQLGRYIHNVPGEEVTFYVVDYQHWSMRDIASSLRADNIHCILECDAGPPRLRSGPLPAPKSRRRSVAASATYRVLKMSEKRMRTHKDEAIRQFIDAYTREYESLQNTINDARALARELRPDVVVIGGNNPGYTTAAYIRGFHDEGIPSVIVSSTMSNGLEEAEVYSGDPRYHVKDRPARAAAFFFPKWMIEHRGLKLLRCPVGRVFAIEALKLAPWRPWVFNSGDADALAMESRAMIDYYVTAGLPGGNMEVTGSPSDDAMARIVPDAPRLREQLYSELGLPPKRPMLLTALPPDFLYVNGGRPQCDFQKYEDIVEFWIRSLADQKTFNVVVALHPSVKVETMRHIERPGVRIASGRTAPLVPLCDLYVASISSTIRWAIAAGKPVINYDVYRYRYTDFLDVPGVLATEEQDEFRNLVTRFATDPAFFAQVRSRQAAAAVHWGRLDGQACERILQLLMPTARATQHAD
jgi:hypothetical protein